MVKISDTNNYTVELKTNDGTAQKGITTEYCKLYYGGSYSWWLTAYKDLYYIDNDIVLVSANSTISWEYTSVILYNIYYLS